MLGGLGIAAHDSAAIDGQTFRPDAGTRAGVKMQEAGKSGSVQLGPMEMKPKHPVDGLST